MRKSITVAEERTRNFAGKEIHRGIGPRRSLELVLRVGRSRRGSVSGVAHRYNLGSGFDSRDCDLVMVLLRTEDRT